MSTTTFEHAFYIGNYMSGILYGLELMMYFATISALVEKQNKMMTAGARTFFMVFSTVLLFLLTVDITVNAVWAEFMWINGRDGPGGVPGFIQGNINVWYQTFGSTCVVAMIFMGDALLLYRLYIIYGSSVYVIALPILAYLAAFSLGIVELIMAFKPGGNFFHGKTVNIGTPYYTLTIVLNIIVTCLICLRLRRLGKAVTRVMGRKNATMYTSATSMFIESAAPYSLVGIMFLIPYAIGDGSAIAFGQVWAKLTCLSPQLIILRICSGHAWGRDTVSRAQSNIELNSHIIGPTTSGVQIHTHVSSDAERSRHGHSRGQVEEYGNGNIDHAHQPSSDTEKWADDVNSYSSFTKVAEAY